MYLHAPPNSDSSRDRWTPKGERRVIHPRVQHDGQSHEEDRSRKPVGRLHDLSSSHFSPGEGFAMEPRLWAATRTYNRLNYPTVTQSHYPTSALGSVPGRTRR